MTRALLNGAQPIDPFVFQDVDGSWYITYGVYHRRPLGETDRNHRVVGIENMRFAADGSIVPVTITAEGVGRDPVR